MGGDIDASLADLADALDGNRRHLADGMARFAGMLLSAAQDHAEAAAGVLLALPEPQQEQAAPLLGVAAVNSIRPAGEPLPRTPAQQARLNGWHDVPCPRCGSLHTAGATRQNGVRVWCCQDCGAAGQGDIRQPPVEAAVAASRAAVKEAQAAAVAVDDAPVAGPSMAATMAGCPPVMRGPVAEAYAEPHPAEGDPFDELREAVGNRLDGIQYADSTAGDDVIGTGVRRSTADDLIDLHPSPGGTEDDGKEAAATAREIVDHVADSIAADAAKGDDVIDLSGDRPLRPLTNAEAEAAYDAAEPVHVSEDRIKEIVAYATDEKSDDGGEDMIDLSPPPTPAAHAPESPQDATAGQATREASGGGGTRQEAAGAGETACPAADADQRERDMAAHTRIVDAAQEQGLCDRTLVFLSV
jgi:ribosomal protein L37AE/L43A